MANNSNQDLKKIKTTSIKELNQRLTEAEQTLNAIQNGEVDALVVSGENGSQVYTLTTAERPYRVMIEQMNEGALTLSADGIILYCNESFARMVGKPRERTVSTSILDYIDPASHSHFKRLVKHNGRGEVSLIGGKNNRIPTYFALNAFTDEQTTRHSVVVTDLTEHVQTEQIIASEKFARSLLEQSPDVILVCDTSGTIIQASERAYALLDTVLVGKPLDWIFSRLSPFSGDGSRQISPFNFTALRDGGIPGGSEMMLADDNGSIHNLVFEYSRITEENVVLGYSVSLADITERKRAEEVLSRANEELEIKVQERTRELAGANEKLKAYGRRITQVQEEERKRIAYELHDDTAQYLSILKMQLGALVQSGRVEDPEILEKLRYLERDADRAFNDVRRYSHELRPGVLEHLGLQSALEQIIEDTNKLQQIRVELKVEGSELVLAEEIKLAFFRIAQEALNNTRKHARADMAAVKLQFFDHRVRMTVCDNGFGFNFKEVLARTGKNGSLGLMSMQERARLIGADLKIQSEPGKGTTVTAEVKL